MEKIKVIDTDGYQPIISKEDRQSAYEELFDDKNAKFPTNIKNSDINIFHELYEAELLKRTTKQTSLNFAIRNLIMMGIYTPIFDSEFKIKKKSKVQLKEKNIAKNVMTIEFPRNILGIRENVGYEIIPVNTPVSKCAIISSMIVSGSAILPGPTSPQACLPSGGHKILKDRFSNFLIFSWVALFCHIC